MFAIQLVFKMVKALVMSCSCVFFDSSLITLHLAVRMKYGSFLGCIQGRLRRSVISFSHLVEQKSPSPEILTGYSACKTHFYDASGIGRACGPHLKAQLRSLSKVVSLHHNPVM